MLDRALPDHDRAGRGRPRAGRASAPGVDDLPALIDTDVAILRAIQAHRCCLWTSEPAVAERTGIPLLPAVDG